MGKNSTCPKCLVLNYLLFTFTLYLSYYVLSECPTHNFGARVVLASSTNRLLLLSQIYYFHI